METLLAFTVISVIGVVLAGVILNQARVFTTQENFVSSGVELNNTLAKIGGDLRQAAGVAVGYPEASPTINSDSFNIVLKLNTIKADGTIDLLKFDYLVITADSSNPSYLREKIYPDATSSRVAIDDLLTASLDSINFNYLDASSSATTPILAKRIKATVSIKSKTGSLSNKATSSTVVSLRNSI